MSMPLGDFLRAALSITNHDEMRAALPEPLKRPYPFIEDWMLKVRFSKSGPTIKSMLKSQVRNTISLEKEHCLNYGRTSTPRA